MSVRRRPTRRDLLIVVGRLQDAIGALLSIYENDRAHDRAGDVHAVGRPAFRLAVDARSFDPPVMGRSRNGWSEHATSPTNGDRP